MISDILPDSGFASLSPNIQPVNVAWSSSEKLNFPVVFNAAMLKTILHYVLCRDGDFAKLFSGPLATSVS